ncbi:hypothetical protein OESDEN_21669 [Oesophagostomum dentatum]|uniref:Uncharacterized protein n=1 Tax=Oesophagostomum dentatum TaxID=61180 RepID=A0A0B1S060_OESDE|nr:hypothetical protein OESDEN_21669 [Oesophagostomum dentatum]
MEMCHRTSHVFPTEDSFMSCFNNLKTASCRGRTEYETVHKDGARLSRRATTTFERRPSQRYEPRQSHAQQRRELTKETFVDPAATKPRSSSVAVEQLVSHLTSSSPMEEKFCPFSDAPQEPPCVRSSSRIPKYVLTSLGKVKTMPMSKSWKSHPLLQLLVHPLKSSNAVDPATDLENVSPASLTISPSNPKAKPNTGIPKPSKLRPPTARHKPAETNIQQEEPRISRIPKISHGAGFRAANNGLR